MTPKEIITETFREGVPKEALPEQSAEVFVDLLPTITDEQAKDLVNAMAFACAQMLLTISAENLITRIVNSEMN